MNGPLPKLEEPAKLVHRLSDGKPIVFLVGSALTMPPAPGAPGVPGVDAILDIIRERISKPRGTTRAARVAARKAPKELARALAPHTTSGAQYQAAFQYLKATTDGAESANSVIREAVLRARSNPADSSLASEEDGTLAGLEASAEGWHLGHGVKALGLMLARHPKRFRRLVLTTNFDPLIEVAIRAAGGRAYPVDHVGDGPLVPEDPLMTNVVHVHGLWRSDTLHTPGALAVDRKALERSLVGLFEQGITLVVMAYGGWDDVLGRALAQLSGTSRMRSNIAWCFYERDPNAVVARYPLVLEMLASLGERSVCYGGVDCNVVLPELRKRMDDESDLIGRGPVCDELLDALDGDEAVEIIGEQFMNRSRLLAWVATQAADEDKIAVRLSARELTRPTPADLVRKIAARLGRFDVVAAKLYRERSMPNDQDAVAALELLEGAWILLDDADVLAVDGHGFTTTFFAELRKKLQAREIHWISVSSRPIGPQFRVRGLSSPFLNDAKKVFAGALDRDEVEVALTVRLGAKADRALELAGTLPALVYRLCDAEGGDVEQVMRDLQGWAEGLCSMWWNERSPEEKEVLERLATGRALDDGRQRTDADMLCKRGLVVECATGFALNGEVWRSYVQRQA